MATAFTEEFWKEIGAKIAALCFEENKELEEAWLKGKKLKISTSITIDEANPPATLIKMSCTAKKIVQETTIYPPLPAPLFDKDPQ